MMSNTTKKYSEEIDREVLGRKKRCGRVKYCTSLVDSTVGSTVMVVNEVGSWQEQELIGKAQTGGVEVSITCGGYQNKTLMTDAML